MNIEILQLGLVLAAALMAIGSGIWARGKPTRAFWIALVAFLSFACGGYGLLQKGGGQGFMGGVGRTQIRNEIVAIAKSPEVSTILFNQDASRDIRFVASLHGRIKTGKEDLSAVASRHIGSLSAEERTELISFISTLSIIDDSMRQNGYTDLTGIAARRKLLQIKKNGGFNLLE